MAVLFAVDVSDDEMQPFEPAGELGAEADRAGDRLRQSGLQRLVPGAVSETFQPRMLCRVAAL